MLWDNPTPQVQEGGSQLESTVQLLESAVQFQIKQTEFETTGTVRADISHIHVDSDIGQCQSCPAVDFCP